MELIVYPNPDIENTMIAQVLDTPRKSIKSFITNKVTLVFLVFLCTSITCTLKRISISRLGVCKNLSFGRKLKYLCILAILFFNNYTFAGDDLLSFDTTKINGYSDDMNVVINEVKTIVDNSTVVVKVFNRGTYVEVGIFKACSFSQIAKKYSYRYYVVVDRNDILGCENCEWSTEYVLRLLKSKSQFFGKKLNENIDYKIKDVNVVSRICGFSPILEDENDINKSLLNEKKQTRNKQKKQEAVDYHTWQC